MTLIEAYLEDLRRRHCAPSTRSNARGTLPRFFAHVRRQARDVRKLEEADVVSFARHLASVRTRQGTPLAVGTQAQYLAVVKAFCGFLKRTRRVLEDPARGVALPGQGAGCRVPSANATRAF